MMVVSMFDGYSSGLQALKDVNIPVSEYHAFEIDPYAIKVSEKNHPEIIRHGDVNDWHKADIDWMNVDLILAGSPCQGFSFAGKQLAFDDPRSALFFKWVELVNFMKLLKGDKCVFMLENVDMKKKHRDVITEKLRVEPVFINSKIHSAFSRPRWYWSNRKITEPQIEDIKVRHLLHDCDEPSLVMSKGWHSWFEQNKEYQLMKQYCSLSEDKGVCLTTRQYASWNGNFIETSKPGVYRKLSKGELCLAMGLPYEYTDCVSQRQTEIMTGNGWQLDTIKHIFKDILS